MREVVLYFGSFNPIHNGHLTIANYILDNELADEVWFIISPHNPLKSIATLAPESDRLAMAEGAVSNWQKAIKVLDIEFTMDKPSYTATTIRELYRQYPEIHFTLLIGEDNAESFGIWREWEEIDKMCRIMVYPRGEVRDRSGDVVKFHYLDDAPLIDISSTEIRDNILNNKSLELLTETSVINYIKERRLYVKG